MSEKVNLADDDKLLALSEGTIKTVQKLHLVNPRRNIKRLVLRIRPAGLAIEMVQSHPMAQVTLTALVVKGHQLLLLSHKNLHKGQRNLSQRSHPLPPAALRVQAVTASLQTMMRMTRKRNLQLQPHQRRRRRSRDPSLKVDLHPI